MHHTHTTNPILDVIFGLTGVSMLSLSAIAENKQLGDIFTVAGWFVITVGVVRSYIWLSRKAIEYFTKRIKKDE